MKEKERSIWKNLLLGLAATPLTAFIGVIVITLIGGIDQAITKIQLSGHWWLILIFAFVLSFLYFIYGPKIKITHERNKVVNALLLYWREQQAKRNYPDPSEEEIKLVRDFLLERVKMWAWFNPELWKTQFPEEKYSDTLFGIVDTFIPYWENQKSKYNIKTT